MAKPATRLGRPNKKRFKASAHEKKGVFYKPLATQFCRKGFGYRQIAREGDGAIYEQKWLGKEDGSIAYEVILIRRRGATEIHGTKVPAREIYPCSTDWGSSGWTLTDKERAFAKLKWLKESRL
jgi:hypothetical protein